MDHSCPIVVTCKITRDVPHRYEINTECFPTNSFVYFPTLSQHPAFITSLLLATSLLHCRPFPISTLIWLIGITRSTFTYQKNNLFRLLTKGGCFFTTWHTTTSQNPTSFTCNKYKSPTKYRSHSGNILVTNYRTLSKTIVHFKANKILKKLDIMPFPDILGHYRNMHRPRW